MDTLYVKIISPSQTLFEGPALSLSSTNSQGNFDILPQHANFLTMTKDVPIILTTPDNKRLEFKLALSIVYNVGNNVSVYTDIVPN
jgi:F0F1-type ATP synthase epsilon subunit